MNKNIKFKSLNNHVWEVRERPIPANKLMPDWWKQIPPYSTEEQKLMLNPAANITVKKCLPAYDAISAGYIMPLWSDIVVSNNNGMGPTLNWVPREQVFDTWSVAQVNAYEMPEGFGPNVFKYLHGWNIETPKGYSILITHPIGYKNLPFRVISGIVDSDNLKTDINTPIVFKKGWEGVLERGTPMFQIIPIKRDNWSSEFIQGSDEKVYYEREKVSTKIFGYYSRNLRSNKVYK